MNRNHRRALAALLCLLLLPSLLLPGAAFAAEPDAAAETAAPKAEDAPGDSEAPAEPTPEPTPEPVPEAETPELYPTGLELNVVNDSLEALDTLQLTAAVYPAECDQSVLWSSSAPEIASVDASGLVTALRKGSAVITATAMTASADGTYLTADCVLTVRSTGVLAETAEQLESEHPYAELENSFWQFTLPGAQNLALLFDEQTALGSGDFLILTDGGAQQLGSYTGAELAGQSVTIPGDTVRIYLVSDGDGSTGWGFKVISAENAAPSPEPSPELLHASVTLDRTQGELEALDTLQLTASLSPADAEGLSLVWTSSDESVATVVDGYVEAIGHGTAAITAAVVTLDADGNESPVTNENGEPAAAVCTVVVINDGVRVSDPAQLESEHPYERPVNCFWEYRSPGARSLVLQFDEQTQLEAPYDYLTIRDGDRNTVELPYTGSLLASRRVEVPGDTVRIYLSSAQNGPGAYGFRVAGVEPVAADAPRSYTVRYFANGGVGAPEPATKTENVPLTLSTTVPTRLGCRFLGWAMDRSTADVVFQPGDTYVENADLTLYAVWERTASSTPRSPSASVGVGPGEETVTAQSPKTPISLERPEANYDKEPLHIRTVEDLIAFSESCSLDTWSDRLPVVLENDLSLSDVDFQPIPLFNGSFDGRGHTLYDLNLTDAQAPCGLFLETGRDATIKNLSVTGSVIPKGDNSETGGLVGLNRGCLMNCSFSGAVAGKNRTGALVGRNEATGLIVGCKSACSVSGLSATGGIAGYNEGTLLSCESSSYVNTESVDPTLRLDTLDTSSFLNFVRSVTTDTAGITTDTGGICGVNLGFVEYCVNNAPVGYSHLGYNVGGIAGRSCGFLNTCANKGEVYGRRDVGGVAGQAEPFVEISQTGNLVSGLSYRLYALHEAINTAVQDASQISDALSVRLNDLSSELSPIEQAFLELRIGDPESVEDLRAVVADTVSAMVGELQSMSANVDTSSDVLTADMQAIEDNLYALSGSALQTVQLLSEAQGNDVLVDDSASEAAEGLTLGKTSGCTNYGEIRGDSNVGGIIGSMSVENELDPENDLSSTDAMVRSTYRFRTVVQRCVNRGSVIAKRECAGGVCGRTDLGYITNCAAYGRVDLEDGAYAGGIAGLCYGTVHSCVAKCALSGEKYVGGILGNGYAGGSAESDRPSECSGCYTLVSIQGRPQFSGAISGGGDGAYSENYFVPAGFAGLNRISIQGKAEPVVFSVFDAVPGLPEESKHFTLRFVVDGAVVKELSFAYGASFDRSVFPEVESRDGAYAVWDRTDLTDLRFDTTVTAEFHRNETALRSSLTRESGRAAAYVIGRFQEGDTLSATQLSTDATPIEAFRTDWLHTIREQLRTIFRDHQPDYSVPVSVAEKLALRFPDDGLRQHTVRYLAPNEGTANYRIYLETPGGYERLSPELFGSYFAFPVSGRTATICLVGTIQSWWILCYIAGALLLLGLIVWLLCLAAKKLRARKKRVRVKKTPAGRKSPRRKRLLLCGSLLILAALVFLLLFPATRLLASLDSYRLLKSFAAEQTDILSNVELQLDDENIEISTCVHRLPLNGSMLTVADQYGIPLYITNGYVYLENGRAFPIMNSSLDQSALLNLVLRAFRKGTIEREAGEDGVCYRTELEDEAVSGFLRMLLSEKVDELIDGEAVQVELFESGNRLRELRFTGRGRLEPDRPFTLNARLLPQPMEEAPQIPQAVLSAIGKADAGTDVLTDDLLILLAAWMKNDRAPSVDASILVQADCGVISADESYDYYRQALEQTQIHCVGSRLFTVYFTGESACTESGTPLNTAEDRLVSSAKLISVARELCLRGAYRCEALGSIRQFTITLAPEDVAGLVSAILPELGSLELSYQDCVLTVQVLDGALHALELRCGGTLRVVTRDMDASVDVIVRYEQPQEHSIPARVREALLG